MSRISKRYNSWGSTLVEAVVAIPILLLMFTASIDFARYLYLRASLNAAANHAASVASVISGLDKVDGSPEFIAAKDIVITEARKRAAMLSGMSQNSFAVDLVLPSDPKTLTFRTQPIILRMSRPFSFVMPLGNYLFSNTQVQTTKGKAVVYREHPWGASTPVASDCRGNPSSFSGGITAVPCPCASDPANPLVSSAPDGSCMCTPSEDPIMAPRDMDPGPGLDCQCPAGKVFKNEYTHVYWPTIAAAKPIREIRKYGCACPNSESAYSWGPCSHFDSENCTCHTCDPERSYENPAEPGWCRCSESFAAYCASLGMGVGNTYGPQGQFSGTCYCVPYPNCPPEDRYIGRSGTACGCPAGSPTSCPEGQVFQNCSCVACPSGTVPSSSGGHCECPSSLPPCQAGLWRYSPTCECSCPLGTYFNHVAADGTTVCGPSGGCTWGGEIKLVGGVWSCVRSE